MGTNRISTGLTGATAALRAGLAAGAIFFGAVVAFAQDPGAPPPAQAPGLLDGIARWLDQQTAKFNSNLRDARSTVENFGQDAGTAARTTASDAKDAADTVTKIPGMRMVRGHRKCDTAPNGAPDCVTAATSICQASGFASGKSVDMTTSEICPPKVYLSGRSSGAECRTETFVSRVLCQ